MIAGKVFIVCFLHLLFQSAQGKRIRSNVTNFIVNGETASQSIGYVVSYQIIVKGNWSHVCGGSIISERHVLTAARCMQSEQPDGKSVLAGTISLTSGGSRYLLAAIKIHPHYIDGYSYDIAILKILGVFKWTQFVRKINTHKIVHSRDHNPGNQVSWISGWGRAHQLHFLLVSILDNEECSRFWQINDQHICTFAGYGRGFCYGDVGGPLTNSDQTLLVGIMSFTTEKCADGLPDVYTRVSSYADWISYTMRTC